MILGHKDETVQLQRAQQDKNMNQVPVTFLKLPQTIRGSRTEVEFYVNLK